jgi:hypothetical protein
MNEDEEYNPEKSERYDIQKIIFGTLLIIAASYLLYEFILTPLSIVYKLNRKLALAALIVLSVSAITMIARISKKSEEKDPDFEIGPGK